MCKGMLLRTGFGILKHLSTKQLWVQGAIQSYGVGVRKIGRDANRGADLLTHCCVPETTFLTGLKEMGLQHSARWATRRAEPVRRRSAHGGGGARVSLTLCAHVASVLAHACALVVPHVLRCTLSGRILSRLAFESLALRSVSDRAACMIRRLPCDFGLRRGAAGLRSVSCPWPRASRVRAILPMPPLRSQSFGLRQNCVCVAVYVLSLSLWQERCGGSRGPP